MFLFRYVNEAVLRGRDGRHYLRKRTRISPVMGHENSSRLDVNLYAV
jgi:hypothetical protein